jgi:hypothetical protein
MALTCSFAAGHLHASHASVDAAATTVRPATAIRFSANICRPLLPTSNPTIARRSTARHQMMIGEYAKACSGGQAWGTGQASPRSPPNVNTIRLAGAVVGFWPRPELDELADWVASGERMAVCLVAGPGGSGKTRLAPSARRAGRGSGWRSFWPPAG